LARTGGSARAVFVRLTVIGWVVVNHGLDALIETTVECRNRDAFFGKFVADSVYSHSGSAEHNAAAALFDGVSRVSRFIRTVHHPEAMMHAAHTDLLWADFDLSRVGLEITD
jgi:hypothetical protein